MAQTFEMFGKPFPNLCKVWHLKGLSDGGAPFKVYGKNKAANEFNQIVKHQKRVNNFNFIKDKFIVPPKSGTIPRQIMTEHNFSFRDIDGLASPEAADPLFKFYI